MSDRGTAPRRLAWATWWLTTYIVATGLLGPACATSVYTYDKNEYVVVANGMAPDGRYAVAAHGIGQDGGDDFHLYLLAEPGHRVIGPLEEVSETLDTAAGAYTAEWSPDSRYVGLLYRSDRHITALNLYRIGNGRAYPITGAMPLSAVTGPGASSAQDIELRARHLELTWRGPGRFLVREESTSSSARLALPANSGNSCSRMRRLRTRDSSSFPPKPCASWAAATPTASSTLSLGRRARDLAAPMAASSPRARCRKTIM